MPKDNGKRKALQPDDGIDNDGAFLVNNLMPNQASSSAWGVVHNGGYYSLPQESSSVALEEQQGPSSSDKTTIADVTAPKDVQPNKKSAMEHLLEVVNLNYEHQDNAFSQDNTISASALPQEVEPGEQNRKRSREDFTAQNEESSHLDIDKQATKRNRQEPVVQNRKRAREGADKLSKPKNGKSPNTNESSKLSEHYIKGTKLASEGKHKESIDFYTKAIWGAPKEKLYYIGKQASYVLMEKHEKALEVLDEALKQCGEFEPDLVKCKIDVLIKMRKEPAYAQAKILSEELLLRTSGIERKPFLKRAATCSTLLGKYQDALIKYSELIGVNAGLDLHSKEPLVLVSRAVLYYKIGEYGLSKKDCEDALVYEKNLSRIYELKALCEMKLGNFAAAFACIKKAIDKFNAKPSALEVKIVISMRKNVFLPSTLETIELCLSKLQDDPQRNNIISCKILTLYEMGCFKELIEEVYRLKDGSINATLLSNIVVDGGRVDKFARLIESSIEFRPSKVLSLWLANLYIDQYYFDKAKQILDTLLTQSTTVKTLKDYTCLTYARLHRYKQDFKSAYRVIRTPSLAVDVAHRDLEISKIRLAVSDCAAPKAEYADIMKGLVRLDLDRPDGQLQLVKLLIYMGSFEEAKNKVDKILSTRPWYYPALEVRASISFYTRHRDSALEDINQCLFHNVRHRAGYIERAKYHIEESKLKEAVLDMHSASELLASDPELSYLNVKLTEWQGKSSFPRIFLDRALQKHSKDHLLILHSIRLMLGSPKWKDAAIKLNGIEGERIFKVLCAEDKALFYNLRAQYSIKNNKLHEANNYLTIAEKICPNNYRTQTSRIAWHVASRNFVVGLKMVENMLVKDPKDNVLILFKGNILQNMGADAKTWYMHNLDATPLFSTSMSLARLYSNEKDYVKAIEESCRANQLADNEHLKVTVIIFKCRCLRSLNKSKDVIDVLSNEITRQTGEVDTRLYIERACAHMDLNHLDSAYADFDTYFKNADVLDYYVYSFALISAIPLYLRMEKVADANKKIKEIESQGLISYVNKEAFNKYKKELSEMASVAESSVVNDADNTSSITEPGREKAATPDVIVLDDDDGEDVCQSEGQDTTLKDKVVEEQRKEAQNDCITTAVLSTAETSTNLSDGSKSSAPKGEDEKSVPIIPPRKNPKYR